MTSHTIKMVGIFLAGFLCMPASLGASQNSAPFSTVDLLKEARLSRSISLEATDISMADLLRRVSGETLLLSADSTCATRKLQLRLKQRSLRTLMQALTELLPGVWVANEKGYRLEMTAKAQHQQQLWWEITLGEGERVRAAKREALLREMRAEVNISKPGSSKDSSNAEGYNASIASNLFFRGLPSKLQEQIADHMADFSAGVGVRLVSDEGALIIGLEEVPSETQQRIQSALANLPEELRPADAVLRGAQLEFINTGNVVYASVLTASGKAFHLHNLVAMQTAHALPLSLDHTNIDSFIKQMGANVPDAWKRLAEYQHRRVWANDLPAHLPQAVLPRPRRADELHRLSEQTNIDYVADYHSLPCRPLEAQERTTPLKYPLREELNRLAVEQDTGWKRRADDLYLFRNNRWYRDDALEVPAPLAVKWVEYALKNKTDAKALLKQVKPTPAQLREQIEWESEVLAKLNVWQIGRGLTYMAVDQHSPSHANSASPDFSEDSPAEAWSKVTTWFPFALTGPRVFQDQNLIRFYHSLDAVQQTALLEGHLDYHSLSPQQQQQCCFLRPILSTQINLPVLLLGIDNSVKMMLLNVPAERIMDWRTPLRLVITSPSLPQPK